ncbi:MAG: HAD family phosphatase [Reyranella sp.]|nr:MAG: HAD family phosphatase [Reyranella sp.]
MLKEPVEAALFDMDGLLIDTEALYIQAMQAAARRLDREMPLSLCHAMIGVPGRECNLMIAEFYGEGFSIDEFRGHFSTHIRGLLEERIPVKPGAVELLDFLAARGIPCAVATSAGRTTAENHLGRAGLLGRFRAVATRDDVAHAKPAPDVYLEAARRLGVSPSRCVAFEDSNVGLTAAHAAGAMAFIVPDILEPHPEVREKALRVLTDLHEARRLLEAVL